MTQRKLDLTLERSGRPGARWVGQSARPTSEFCPEDELVGVKEKARRIPSPTREAKVRESREKFPQIFPYNQILG